MMIHRKSISSMTEVSLDNCYDNKNILTTINT